MGPFPLRSQDFSEETEAMSATKASLSREAARLLHLSEDDCSTLRAQLMQMEADWNKLTSELSNSQEQLQQVMARTELKKLGLKEQHHLRINP